MTREQFVEKIQPVWATRRTTTQWASLELMLVEILRSDEMSIEDKLRACEEAIDAYTRRGYFAPGPFTPLDKTYLSVEAEEKADKS